MMRRRIFASVLLAATLAACEVVDDDAARRDTSVLGASASGDALPGDTAGALARMPGDTTAAGADTGAVLLHPERPRRGDVIFALARGLAVPEPRCGWRGGQIPCHAVPGGLLAMLPLPADQAAGTYTVTFERPSGAIVRQVIVQDRDFGRELVFLNDSLMRLVRRSRDIARDARALRGVLSTHTPERHWEGRWREPLRGGESSGYGVERFYFPASDSTRAISLGPRLRTGGGFGTDTVASGGEAPGWRHAGVDIPARRGAAIVAPAAGVVAKVGEYTLPGRTVIIDHGQGVHSAYFHLDTALVREGDLVRAGRTIARVGSTGLATGPHLHYGIYIHGRDVDPASWQDMPGFARGDTTAAGARRQRAGGR